MISPIANMRRSFGLTFSENSAEVIDSFHPEYPASFFARGVTRKYKETRRVCWNHPRIFNLFARLIVVLGHRIRTTKNFQDFSLFSIKVKNTSELVAQL